ncbi:MAG TPA: hypothetical protein VK574_21115 [Terracidiphilus sp.]|nr:hypothetical protein [Terracidiphilus sp.]
MSSRTSKSRFTRPTSLALAVGLAAAGACAQYPGQIIKKDKATPELRAIAVLEWTGDEGKPKTSRIVPITVYDGQALQDGGVYLARPQPLALTSEVEYELEKNGARFGLYDIRTAGQEQGSWVGYGLWKPLPSAKPAAPKPVVDDGFDANDDKPVLHRKHEGNSGSSDSGASGPSPDPDRPTLHKKSGTDDSGKSTSSSGPAADPDRPTMHKKTSDDSSPSGSTSSSNSDHPVLHKGTESSADTNDGERTGAADPDRPHLMRGKPTGNGPDVLPSLMGLPADMQQAVAVSDERNHPEHQWNYAWANPDDELKMKEDMEDIARKSLDLTPPLAPKTKRVAAKAHAKPAPPPEPPPLMDEKFRVFELAYGSGATMVLSAHTDGPAKQQKFVTLIAQPDLYGNALVLLKNVTDGEHLDETPRMKLIDAVDALADNRGELLFELRGATQRQFALYRVLRGTAEKIFITGGGEYGIAPGE